MIALFYVQEFLLEANNLKLSLTAIKIIVYNNTMFTLDSSFNIAFLVSALALLIIFAGSILTRIIMLKRERSGAHVFYLTINAIFIVLMLIISAFFAFAAYPNNVISVTQSNSNLLINVFSLAITVPKCGIIVDLIVHLNVAGVIAPLAILCLSIINIFVIMFRTFKVKKQRKIIEVVVSDAQGRAEEISHEDIKGIGQEFIPYLPSGKSSKPPRKSAETAAAPSSKSILSEIDILVTASKSDAVIVGSADIKQELDRAIKEGLKLTENIFADVEQLETYDDEVLVDDEDFVQAQLDDLLQNQPETYEDDETEEPDENDEDDETYEDYGNEEELYQDEETYEDDDFEIDQVTLEQEPQIETAKVEPQIEKAERINSNDNIDIEHYEEQLSNDVPSFNNVYVPKVRTISRKPPAGEKNFSYTRAKNERADIKRVEATDSGLPLTKKYIILNRQCAANVFSDYLKQKQKGEQGELTESLNTIILK